MRLIEFAEQNSICEKGSAIYITLCEGGGGSLVECDSRVLGAMADDAVEKLVSCEAARDGKTKGQLEVTV